MWFVLSSVLYRRFLYLTTLLTLSRYVLHSMHWTNVNSPSYAYTLTSNLNNGQTFATQGFIFSSLALFHKTNLFLVFWHWQRSSVPYTLFLFSPRLQLPAKASSIIVLYSWWKKPSHYTSPVLTKGISAFAFLPQNISSPMPSCTSSAHGSVLSFPTSWAGFAQMITPLPLFQYLSEH